MPKYASTLRSSEWRAYRERVFAELGRRCAKCSRTDNEDGAVLQVHHIEYLPGRLPWDHPVELCEVLCRGCHAREHGLILPTEGWVLVSSDDNEECDFPCERCGTLIRYEYSVFNPKHPKWGVLTVGCVCCDRLTNTSEASENQRVREAEAKMLKAFMCSPRWRAEKEGSTIKRNGYRVWLRRAGAACCLSIGGTKGKQTYPTITTIEGTTR